MEDGTMPKYTARMRLPYASKNGKTTLLEEILLENIHAKSQAKAKKVALSEAARYQGKVKAPPDGAKIEVIDIVRLKADGTPVSKTFDKDNIKMRVILHQEQRLDAPPKNKPVSKASAASAWLVELPDPFTDDILKMVMDVDYVTGEKK
jgi:hypothetical protein